LFSGYSSFVINASLYQYGKLFNIALFQFPNEEFIYTSPYILRIYSSSSKIYKIVNRYLNIPKYIIAINTVKYMCIIDVNTSTRLTLKLLERHVTMNNKVNNLSYVSYRETLAMSLYKTLRNANAQGSRTDACKIVSQIFTTSWQCMLAYDPMNSPYAEIYSKI